MREKPNSPGLGNNLILSLSLEPLMSVGEWIKTTPRALLRSFRPCLVENSVIRRSATSPGKTWQPYSADRVRTNANVGSYCTCAQENTAWHTQVGGRDKLWLLPSRCKWLRAVILRRECHYAAQIPSQQIPLQQRYLYNKNPFKLWLTAHVLQAIFDVRFGVYSNGNWPIFPKVRF